jgi:hypothetical protein
MNEGVRLPVTDRPSHQIGQLFRGTKRLALLALFNYPPGNPPGLSFFAVLKEDICYLFFRESKQKSGSGFIAAPGIHAHIERGVKTKAEPSCGRVKLQGRHSQINKDSTDLAGIRFSCYGRKLAKIRVHRSKSWTKAR